MFYRCYLLRFVVNSATIQVLFGALWKWKCVDSFSAIWNFVQFVFRHYWLIRYDECVIESVLLTMFQENSALSGRVDYFCKCSMIVFPLPFPFTNLMYSSVEKVVHNENLPLNRSSRFCIHLRLVGLNKLNNCKPFLTFTTITHTILFSKHTIWDKIPWFVYNEKLRRTTEVYLLNQLLQIKN